MGLYLRLLEIAVEEINVILRLDRTRPGSDCAGA